MTALRYNNQGGTLGGSLTSGGTTITFAVAPDFATLTGGQTITLVLEPGTSNMEIVYLTAYTATQTTGTITRQAEDSTNWPAVSHASGVPWSASPTIYDFTNPTVTGDMTMPTSAFSSTTGGFVGGAIRSGIGRIINNTYTQTVGPVITTVAGASIGANVASITTLIVADTLNPPTTGSLKVPTNAGTAVIAYTGFNGGTKTFSGVTLTSGSGTLLSTSGGVSTATTGSSFDTLMGSPMLIQYNPSINYAAGPSGPTTYTTGPIGPRGLVQVEGTYTYSVSNTAANGISPVFQNEMIYRNDPAVAASFCIGEGFVNCPQGIGDTLAANFVPINAFNVPGEGQNWTCGFTDCSVYTTVNGGTLGGTNPGQQVAFLSLGPNIGAGVTFSQRVGMLIHDSALTGGGVLTTQYGIRIGQLQQDGIALLPFSNATTSIGIDCASPVLLGGSTSTVTAALPAATPNVLTIKKNTYTYNFSNATAGINIADSGTHIMQQSANTTLMGAGYQYNPTFTNISSVSANLGPVVGIAATPILQADTKTITASSSNTILFSAAPQTKTINAGTLTVAGIVNYQSSAITFSGSTITALTHFSVAAPTNLGTITTQVGLDIVALTGAGTNIGIRNFSSLQQKGAFIATNNTVSVSGNAGTVPVTNYLSTLTNSSAGTLTVTMTTTGATDGQIAIVRIFDSTGASQGITWVNTEVGAATPSATTRGSTTIPTSNGFIFNSSTTKWTCMAAG